MGQPDLVSGHRLARGQSRYGHAFAASFAFHGLLVASLIALACLYRPHYLVIHNGSTPGATVISLKTLVIVAPPSTPAPRAPVAAPLPVTTALPAKISPVATVVSSPQPPRPMATHAQPPEAGVRVFAGPVTKPVPAATAKPGAPAREIASTAADGTGIKHLRPASAKYISSYAPGTSVFPHPPYPPEARDLQQTGVVRMMIHFDPKGDVTQAEVAQSSGVAILDSETRAYICEHWHSQAYAGQAVSVPVEYSLTSL